MNDFQVNVVQVSNAFVRGELEKETYIALVSVCGVIG